MSLALLALLVACSTPEPEAPAPEPATEAAPEPAPEPAADAPSAPDWQTRKHMDMNFAFVTDALWLTFGGNLDGVKAEAAKLADHPPVEAKTEAWKPFLDELHTKSTAMKDLESLEDAKLPPERTSRTCSDVPDLNLTFAPIPSRFERVPMRSSMTDDLPVAVSFLRRVGRS